MSRKDFNVVIPRRGIAILLLIVVSGAVLVLASCGGDDEEEKGSPVSTYLTQLSALISLGNVQVQALEGRYPAAFAEVDPTREYYASYIETYDRFLDATKELPVPADVRDAHDEYVSASEALAEINRARLEGLETAATLEAVNAVLADEPAYTGAVERQAAACRALLSIAEAQDVNVPGLTECNEPP